MTSKRLLFALIWWLGSVVYAQEPSTPDARHLLQSAHEVSGLDQLVAYRIRAVIVLDPGEPSAKKGKISMYRDHDKSRTDIQVDDYREIKTTLGNKLYVWRSTLAPMPALAHMAETDLFFWDRLAKDSDAKLGEVTRKKVRGRLADCFDVKRDQSHRQHRLCFDPSRKVLLENFDLRFALEFSDYTALDQWLMPQKITMLSELPKSEKPILILQDIEVQKAHFAPAAFAVPEHSMEFETCDKMRPATNLQMTQPKFDANIIRKNLHAGTSSVNAYGVIDKDGNLQNIVVLSQDKEVVEPIMEALKKRRYSPAMCGSSPVATEKEIVVLFSVPMTMPGGISKRP